jgi:hypothetical protein
MFLIIFGIANDNGVGSLFHLGFVFFQSGLCDHCDVLDSFVSFFLSTFCNGKRVDYSNQWPYWLRIILALVPGDELFRRRALS